MLKYKIEEYFTTPRVFLRFVSRYIEFCKCNQQMYSMIIPVFKEKELKFSIDFNYEDISPTMTNEYFKLENPFYYGMRRYEEKEWWIFKEILKKFTENQKT